jgi:hypothetical protein
MLHSYRDNSFPIYLPQKKERKKELLEAEAFNLMPKPVKYSLKKVVKCVRVCLPEGEQ